MADSIADILGGKGVNEPSEIAIIQQYLIENFRSESKITIQDRQIIISVRGAALAGTLRMHLHELKELCQTEKRLIIRIN